MQPALILEYNVLFTCNMQNNALKRQKSNKLSFLHSSWPVPLFQPYFLNEMWLK